jgi:hypothetical protein
VKCFAPRGIRLAAQEARNLWIAGFLRKYLFYAVNPAKGRKYNRNQAGTKHHQDQNCKNQLSEIKFLKLANS